MTTFTSEDRQAAQKEMILPTTITNSNSYHRKELTDDVAKYHYNKGHEDGRKLAVVEQITDEEIHQAIRRGFSREGFLSDGIFLEIKELLRNTQGVNSEQVPDFFFMENDLMGKR